ncbi:MAG: exosortase/archaeosortase family protein [Nitrospirae bacterium]|nr:MAG: exosortase/archaeosortase family protein [Nitrospirota bacterium]
MNTQPLRSIPLEMLADDQKRLSRVWRTAFGSLIAGFLGLLYHDIVGDMVHDWYRDPDYSHGFLVPLLSGYFLWERRERLGRCLKRPSIWGVGLLGCGLSLLIVGTIGAELYTQRMSLMIELAGLVLLIYGWDCLRLLSFPIGFLVFMVPLPAIVVNALAFPLQLFAAKTAAFCLFSLGIPVLREGNLIVLAGATLEVAEACSGLRSLLSLLALGTVYGYFSQREHWKRWVLVGLTIPIAILANACRVSGTGIIAHLWGAEAAQGFYHTFEGWIVFVVAFALLVGCGTVLSRVGSSRRSASN